MLDHKRISRVQHQFTPGFAILLTLNSQIKFYLGKKETDAWKYEAHFASHRSLLWVEKQSGHICGILCRKYALPLSNREGFSKKAIQCLNGI